LLSCCAVSRRRERNQGKELARKGLVVYDDSVAERSGRGCDTTIHLPWWPTVADDGWCRTWNRNR
jgi:hypothetical protein